jgi:hypothetical protein
MSQAIQSVKYGASPVLIRQYRPEPLLEDVKDKLRKIVERVEAKI